MWSLMSLKTLYPGCQLLLTYDNAPSHVAVRKGALPVSKMNRSDGGKQPIITQMGWFEMLDVATGMMKKVEQQMCSKALSSLSLMSSIPGKPRSLQICSAPLAI